MNASPQKTRLFVEAIPLVEDRPSGISRTLLGLVSSLVADKHVQQKYEIVLVAPKRALHKLDRYPALKSCTRKGLPMRMRILSGLMKFRLLPPMDLLLGRGVYLFCNFKNWPVTKRSFSLSYIHDICFAVHPEFVSPPLQRMLINKIPKFIEQSDIIITVSEASKREIIDFYHLPSEKLLVLLNGVDTTLFRPYATDEVATARARYGIPEKYFLFVGNIEPRKNLERLVRAYDTLPRDTALVLIGGSGWLNEGVYATIDQARANGAQIIQPDVWVSDEEVAVLMSGAIALVHPAIHEGFGLPPAEAMAVGTPVVVADIPVLHEVAGEAGIYCDPMDEASIATAMQRAQAMSPKDRSALVTKGTVQVRQFSWQKTARTLFDFLNDPHNRGQQS